MALITVGNKNPKKFADYESEGEFEDEFGEIEVKTIYFENFFENEILGIEYTFENQSYNKKVILHYYKASAVSDYYDDYVGLETEYLIPLIYVVKNNRPYECLNKEITKYTVDKSKDYWFDVTVELTRDINKNEDVFIGFYSNALIPKYDFDFSFEENDYAIYKVADFNLDIQRKIEKDYFNLRNIESKIFFYTSLDEEAPALYFEFFDSPLSISIVNSIKANDLIYRRKSAKIVSKSKISLNDKLSFQKIIQRILSDIFSVKDSLKKQFNYIRKKITELNPKTNLTRKTDAKRFEKSFAETKSKVNRKVENTRGQNEEIIFSDKKNIQTKFCRNTESNIFLKSQMLIGRTIEITIKTMAKFWDFVKKTILHENTTIILFSPITTEIQLESKL